MIGVISDTHDNVPNVKKAVKLFEEKNVDFAVHLGDIVAPATVKFFEGIKVKFLQGNCDGDIRLIKKRAEDINGQFLGRYSEFSIKNKKIAALHGDDMNALSKIINSGDFDYVLHGHTHQTRNEKIGKTRVINPGAHYFMAENTVVLLDVEKDKVEFVKVR